MTAAVMMAALDSAQPFQVVQKATRQDLADQIAAIDDFDELTGPVAQKVAESGLALPQVEQLQKQLAKKAGISVKAIKEDARRYKAVHADKDTNHLDAAREVVRAFGTGNLIYAINALWRWRGDGVWRQVDDREVKSQVHDVSGTKDLTKSIADSILDLENIRHVSCVNCAHGS